jgi:hypothetical protein
VIERGEWNAIGFVAAIGARANGVTAGVEQR